MKTYKNLFEEICSFENLLKASRKAQKGKRYKDDAACFNLNLEKELLRLIMELPERSYSPGRYKTFYIREPKIRLISAAPYRDRVVHHALCNVIEPIFERTFISDSFANRKNKGTHRAMLRYQEFCRKNRYVLKCDIQKFFASIDHEILKSAIRRKIADEGALWLSDLIIDSSNPQEEVLVYFPGDRLFEPIERRKGLPIGNLTSQFFANVYLNPFDHFVKETLQFKHYVRYVDDFVLFENEKQRLHEAKQEIIRFLQNFRLKLHEGKSNVFPVWIGLRFLGHRIFPDHRRLDRGNVVRFRRKIRSLQKRYYEGSVSWPKIEESLQAWNAHASFSDTYGLRNRIFSEAIFVRKAAHNEPCAPRRFLEQ